MSGAEGLPPKRRLTAFPLLLVGAGVPLLVTLLFALRADRRRAPALSGLAPVAAAAARAGEALTHGAPAKVAAAGVGIAALFTLVAIVGLVRRKREGLGAAAVLLASGLAALGQTRLLVGRLSEGTALYGAALLLFGTGLLLRRKDAPPSSGQERPAPLLWGAVAALLVVSWAGLFYRFYALNQLVPDFDGEAAWFMAGATSLSGAAQINAGGDGPWSPFGWLYYLPVWFFTRTCGTTLLSIRLVSAVIGFLTLPLLFGLLRRMAGTFEALLGTLLLAFGLTDLYWSRTDIFPYHAPGTFAILIAWAAYRAVTAERTRDFAACALLMALSYHQYPSGQTLFLVPLGAWAGRALLTGGFLRRTWKKALLLLLGAALWGGGIGINNLIATGTLRFGNPFALNPGKTLWSVPLPEPGLGPRARFLAESATRAAGVVVRTEFVRVVPSGFPHHEAIPAFPGLPTRHVAAPLAVLLSLGVVLLVIRVRRPESLVLLSWIVAGALPGLLAEFPATRRIASLFPAFAAVAALAGGAILRAAMEAAGRRAGRILAAATLILLFAGLAAVTGFLYLGPRPGVPPSVATADAVRGELASGTLAIFEADYGEYLTTEVAFQLLDHLNAGPRPPHFRIAQFLDWPVIAFRPAPVFSTWLYRYTLLRGRAAELAAGPPPERITYLVQETDARREKRELLSQLYPDRPFRHLRVSERQDYNFAALTVAREEAEACQKPVVTLSDSGSGMDPSAIWQEVPTVVRRDATARAPGIAAGLWVPDLRRVMFRFAGAGEGHRLLLDGEPHPDGEVRPLTRGIHRLDLTLGASPRLPLRLEASVNGRGFETVRPEDVTSPRLASLPALRAEPALPYPGFDPPVPAATVETSFLSGIAVGPDGAIATVHSRADEWRLDIHSPDGGPPVSFRQPRPAGEAQTRAALTFVGESDLALLAWPHLFVFGRDGRPRREIGLASLCRGAEDVGGNEAGELFVLSEWPRTVLVLSEDGRETARLAPREGAESWHPVRVSASLRGPVAVRDTAGRITLFEKRPGAGWFELRVEPVRYAIDEERFTVRSDGWLFALDSAAHEWVVFDREGKRRVARERFDDPSRFPPPHRFLGFDREGRFFVAAEGRVSKLVPAASGTSGSGRP